MIREEEGAGVTRDGKLNYDDLYIYVTTVIIGSFFTLPKGIIIIVFYLVNGEPGRIPFYHC